MTLVAKVFGTFLGVATLGAGIAVPLAQQHKRVSSLPVAIIKNFPEQDRTKDKCQVLTKDDSKENYLLICNFEEDNSPRFFYFQEEKGKLSHVNYFTNLERKENKGIKFKLSLSDNGVTNSGEGEIITSHHEWIDFLSISGLNSCRFTNKPKGGSRWSIQCTQGNSKKQDIHLAPIVFKNK